MESDSSKASSAPEKCSTVLYQVKCCGFSGLLGGLLHER